MYLALYRKYRPKSFDEVVGQDNITTTLKNQIKSGEISHAYLFNGTRGTGKTSIAKIFAKAINCQSNVNGNACLKCSTCLALDEPNNMDILEIDAASNNRVDEIREIREKVKYPPVNGKYKVYIIDEVHMLTDSAFNALLKTLEEPPAHVVFILATTEIQKLPATILSRCLRFDFKLVGTEVLSAHIANLFEKEGVKYEKEATHAIASLGEGSVRDALSIADMVLSFSNKNVTYKSVTDSVGAIDKKVLYELGGGILKGQGNLVISLINSIEKEGKSPTQIAKDLSTFFRDVAVIKTTNNYKEILGLPEDYVSVLEGIANDNQIERVLYNLKAFSSLENEFRNTLNPRLVLEVTALNQTVSDYSDILRRLDELEKVVFSPHFSDKKSKVKNLSKSASDSISINPSDMIIDNRIEKLMKATIDKVTDTEVGNKKTIQNAKMQNNENDVNNINKDSAKSKVDDVQRLVEKEFSEISGYADEYFISDEVINNTGGSFAILESFEEPEKFVATELIKKSDDKINEKWLYGQLLIELRNRSEYSIHGMLGQNVELQINENKLTLMFGDKVKYDRIKLPHSIGIIESILKDLNINLKLECLLDEKMSVKKDTIESKLRQIFGNKLVIE